MIRDGWLESEAVNQLDAAGEVFFLRVCLRADDFGRYHANPTLLKSNLYPLSENVRSTDIPRWLAACEKAGLVRCYEADAKPFLEILKFRQRIRSDVKPKYPNPPRSAADSRGPPPYASAEPKAKALASADAGGRARANGEKSHEATDREADRTLPEILDTPAFRTAWLKWVLHWSATYNQGRCIPSATADSHLKSCLNFGSSTAATAVLDNAIARGLREPAAPKSNGGATRSTVPRIVKPLRA